MSLGIIMELLAFFHNTNTEFSAHKVFIELVRRNFLEGRTSYKRNIKVTIMSMSRLLIVHLFFVHLTFSLHRDLVL
jgi:hypothetical protein